VLRTSAWCTSRSIMAAATTSSEKSARGSCQRPLRRPIQSDGRIARREAPAAALSPASAASRPTCCSSARYT
jgi:hypothetical protein